MAQLAVAAVAGAGQLYKGQQISKIKEEEAAGYRKAAGRRRAVSHREAAEERRNKEHMYSRALAVAAASGGGTGDPGVVKLLGDLNAEGEYRVLSRLWAGQDESEGLLYRADQAKREGDSAVKASYVNAVTSAVSGYSSFGGGDRFTQSEQMKRGLVAAKAAA